VFGNGAAGVRKKETGSAKKKRPEKKAEEVVGDQKNDEKAGVGEKRRPRA